MIVFVAVAAGADPGPLPDGLTPIPTAAAPRPEPGPAGPPGPAAPAAVAATPAAPAPPVGPSRAFPVAAVAAALAAALAAGTTTRIRTSFPEEGFLPAALDGTATAARVVLLASVVVLAARAVPPEAAWVVPALGLAAAVGLVWSVRDTLPALVAWVARGRLREPPSPTVEVVLALPTVSPDRARAALRGAALGSPGIASDPAVEVGSEAGDPERWRVRVTLADPRWARSFAGSFPERVWERLAASTGTGRAEYAAPGKVTPEDSR